jgi:hypothetical protein
VIDQENFFIAVAIKLHTKLSGKLTATFFPLNTFDDRFCWINKQPEKTAGEHECHNYKA